MAERVRQEGSLRIPRLHQSRQTGNNRRVPSKLQVELLERDAELSSIHSALSSALDGHGRTVLVTGDPGIGKTSLLEASADAARERGFRVLGVRADALEGELSFGVCAQLFTGVAREAVEDDASDLFLGAAANARPILGGAAEIPPAIGGTGSCRSFTGSIGSPPTSPTWDRSC
jgi:hypothetical protein